MADSISKIILPSGLEYNIASDIINCYPRSGVTELNADWLSLTQDGQSLTPKQDKIYILLQGTNNDTYVKNTQFKYNGSKYQVINTMSSIESISNLELEELLT